MQVESGEALSRVGVFSFRMAAEADMKEPMFWSVEAALSFAARTSVRPILKGSGIYSMRPDKTPRETVARPLTPQDKLAQAAMIMRITEETLDQTELAYVAARYWGQVEEALSMLIPFCVAGLPSGIHYNRAVADMIRNCFPSSYLQPRKSPSEPLPKARRPVSMRQLRGDLRCRMTDAIAHQKTIRIRFADFHTLVMARLDMVLRERGVVHDEDAA